MNHLYRKQIEDVFRFLSTSPRTNIDPLVMCDFLAVIFSNDPDILQRILEATDVVDRMREVLIICNKEIEVGKVQQTVSKQVRHLLPSHIPP